MNESLVLDLWLDSAFEDWRFDEFGQGKNILKCKNSS